ncbi:hypothetical protein [Roseomonas elaeocarpi]|uniref:Uncharacterized protein n=1 Tax=Roseomonas elaeocarpi TaxID=907779 RepID=A0ABV6K1C6_9PROT
MAVDLTSKSLGDLQQIIANAETRGMTSHPLYLAAQEELGRRREGGDKLNLERTREAVLAAAKREEFLSYRDVAHASGLEWGASVRSRMKDHLGELCLISHRQGLPLLSAIVVKMEEVPTGSLSGPALEGFLSLARRLGFETGATAAENERFLRAEQKKVFAWAKKESR